MSCEIRRRSSNVEFPVGGTVFKKRKLRLPGPRRSLVISTSVFLNFHPAFFLFTHFAKGKHAAKMATDFYGSGNDAVGHPSLRYSFEWRMTHSVDPRSGCKHINRQSRFYGTVINSSISNQMKTERPIGSATLRWLPSKGSYERP